MNLPSLLLRLKPYPPMDQLLANSPISDLIIKLKERVNALNFVLLVQNGGKIGHLVEQVLELRVEDFSHVDFHVGSVSYVEEVW